jgi:cytosine/adenosine deaminase-related metal-dependent hydrolase
MQRLTARWIVPVDQPPIAWGAIEIDGERICVVGPADSLKASRPNVPTVDLAEAIVLPGLVNAHTHLEFSNLARPIPAGNGFGDWIGQVVAHRRGQHDAGKAVEVGWGESLASGVTTIGEIATSDAWRELPVTSPAGVVYREVIGLLPERWDAALAAARYHLSRMKDGWTLGLSPHASYSVHPELYERLIDLAVEANAPVAVHLAETQDELELLQHGRGPLVEQLRKFGAWRDGLLPAGRSVLDYLMPLAAAKRGLVIHGNYLTDAEIEFLAGQPNMSVVYCPRTHAAFGHVPHPWLRLIAAGVRVALGTDSRASNPDLSLWNEVRFLADEFPDVDPAALIRMATLNGAQALGCDADAGSLTQGKLANVIVLRPAESSDGTEPEAFALSATSIAGVMRSGQWSKQP